MVLQTPLPEFCNQTSHPAHSLLGRGARPFLSIKVTVLARTLCSHVLFPLAPGTAGHPRVAQALGGATRRRQAGRGSQQSALLLGPNLEGQREDNGEFASVRSSTAQGWCRLEDWRRHVTTVGDRGRARKPQGFEPCSAPHAPFLGKQVQPLSHSSWRDPHLQASQCSPPRPERVETVGAPPQGWNYTASPCVGKLSCSDALSHDACALLPLLSRSSTATGYAGTGRLS